MNNGRRLKVCLVSAAYYPYPSGVSEHVHHLAESLRGLGQDVHILTTTYSGFGGCPEMPNVTRFGRAVLVPLNRSYATLPVGIRLSAQVRGFLRQSKPDVVHCHGVFWPEISYWAIRHSRTVNVITFLTAGFGLHTAGSGLFRRLFAGELRKIHGRIAISIRARQTAEPYIPGDYRVIPCGVDLTRFRPDLAPIGGSGPRPPTILFLSRLDGRKGIEVLLKAMPSVLQSVPTARLRVVGRGPLDRTAHRLVEELGIGSAVTFVGAAPKEDLPRYYADCDVYCSPALGGEALGIVLLEAMAAGAPVVASRIPGYDETVRDSVDGLLVPPRDPAALAATLVRILRDPDLKSRFTKAGLARAHEYAWPAVAARTLGFYRELLAVRG